MVKWGEWSTLGTSFLGKVGLDGIRYVFLCNFCWDFYFDYRKESQQKSFSSLNWMANYLKYFEGLPDTYQY